MKIRKKLIDSAMLKGVISMPKNIFSNTGTSVSVDKANYTLLCKKISETF